MLVKDSLGQKDGVACERLDTSALGDSLPYREGDVGRVVGF